MVPQLEAVLPFHISTEGKPITMMERSEIQKRFGKHASPLEGYQVFVAEMSKIRSYSRYAALAETAREEASMLCQVFVDEMSKILPDSHHSALAAAALKEASMWSHKSVA